ncbi:MAG: hypothetical protein IPP27_03630 [Bacteroidetes bacterium]|nr:hypothetical protein [Bacteroidota bacterium]
MLIKSVVLMSRYCTCKSNPDSLNVEEILYAATLQLITTRNFLSIVLLNVSIHKTGELQTMLGMVLFSEWRY